MLATLAHVWGYSEDGTEVKRQIIISDGDHDIVVSTEWSDTTFRYVFRRPNTPLPSDSLRIEVPETMVQQFRDHIGSQNAFEVCCKQLECLAY